MREGKLTRAFPISCIYTQIHTVVYLSQGFSPDLISHFVSSFICNTFFNIEGLRIPCFFCHLKLIQDVARRQFLIEITNSFLIEFHFSPFLPFCCAKKMISLSTPQTFLLPRPYFLSEGFNRKSAAVERQYFISISGKRLFNVVQKKTFPSYH